MAEYQNNESATTGSSKSDEGTTKLLTDDDFRVNCTNSSSLNTMFEIAVNQASDWVESQSLPSNEKTLFKTKFTEQAGFCGTHYSCPTCNAMMQLTMDFVGGAGLMVFKNIIQENVSVNGLPWVVSTEMLNKLQKEEQKQETNDALLSKLSQTLEETARKRKKFPELCCKIYGQKLQHEYQNIKERKIQHLETLPSTSKQIDIIKESNLSFPCEELVEISQDISLIHTKIQAQHTEVEKIQSNIDFANDIAKRQKTHLETLYGTSYSSE